MPAPSNHLALTIITNFQDFNFKKMDELKIIAKRIISEEFKEGIEKGLIQKDVDERELKSLYEYNVILLYELICANPDVKARVTELQSQRSSIRLTDIFKGIGEKSFI